MRVILDENQVKITQEKFMGIFKNNATYTIQREIGHHGGNIGNIDVFYHNSEDIWVAFTDLPNRYWNAFGIGEPKDKLLSITCEINIPLKGVNKNISGVYVIDEDGSTYMLHSGRIGGSKKGVGKELFDKNYHGNKKMLFGKTYAVIGNLDDPGLISDVAHFVREVQHIKDINDQLSR